MNTVSRRASSFARLVALGAALAASSFAASPALTAQNPPSADAASTSGNGRAGRTYTVHNLVSDSFVPADHTDADLVNPWGLVFNPNGFAWIANNGTGLSTLYDGLGVKNSLVVTIPTPPDGEPPSAPTGIVFSSGSDFVVTVGQLSGPSRFIFATEDGGISGWAPNVDPTHAIFAARSSSADAVYKGLALAANGTARFLYATDFRNRRIDVYDATFHQVTPAGSFTDPRVPEDFAPFGIQNILGNLYVTYAKQNEEREDDVKGAGLGIVDVFDPDGQLIRRLVTRGALNAPWGLALAPANFGRFSGALLVGNFGDGRINAYDPVTGAFHGRLRDANRDPIEIEGLWGLQFGNGLLNQPINTLFFTAGPGDEEHGLYGRIDPTPANNGNGDENGDPGDTDTSGPSD